MLSLFDACNIFYYAKNIKLYGDQYQIGDIDMMSLPGNRRE